MGAVTIGRIRLEAKLFFLPSLTFTQEQELVRLTMFLKWGLGVASNKRMVVVPCVCITVIFVVLHLHYIATYPAQLMPPAEYYPTLRASLPVFPESMHHALTDALTRPIQPTFVPPLFMSRTAPKANTSLIPNCVYQTDINPPSPSDAHAWDANGFERLFLNDEDARMWVDKYFGDSDVARAYHTLPRPIMCVCLQSTPRFSSHC